MIEVSDTITDIYIDRIVNNIDNLVINLDIRNDNMRTQNYTF